jgi:lipopolysaccharide/colanic/teichoic acid biosynthesis glycosyltransferase
MSTGLQGIAGDRLRWAPASRESLVYLERRSLSKGALSAKRGFDIVVASITLVATLPIMAIAAILIKRQDGGPVLFRQARVGRNGQIFTLYKLRSMTPNAEAIKHELVEQNFRDGPLFKMPDDPRVTPIGRFLRLSSIDELPQLVNVLQGHMSIVGPRPALPEEVEQFDDELLARQNVLPGITGLWQLDARDHVSFDSYQRLDIHYVENWSIGLDITIFAGTIVGILRRLLDKGTG